jgi:hypothetical protein
MTDVGDPDRDAAPVESTALWKTPGGRSVWLPTGRGILHMLHVSAANGA